MELNSTVVRDDDLVLDPVVIAQLERITGFDGAGILRELITVFVSSSLSRLARIGGCLDCGDWRGTERHAQSLAGSASSLGARRLAGLCRSLREAAADGDMEQSRVTSAELGREFELVRHALESR